MRGDGLRLYAEDGTEYLDAVAGTFNLPLGYNHPCVIKAVEQQLGLMSHISSDLARPHAQRLVDRLLQLAPPGIDAGWIRDATGSTAVECAIKIAQKATGKSDVITLFHAHHGQTTMAGSISGPAWRRRRFPAYGSPGVLRVPDPNCRNCFYKQTYPSCGILCAHRIADIVQQAGRESTACLIVEPVLGNGGNIVPPEGYFQTLRKICDDLGILLIADEVQTGVGRVGSFFASARMGIEPDIIVLGKGLGGVGLPIGAVLMRQELDVLEPADHSFTGGGNLLALAAAHATLDVVGDEGFLAGVRRRGGYLGELLGTHLQSHPVVGDVRGVGMMWGVEIVGHDGRPDAGAAAAVVSCARERYRLITRSSEYGRGNVVKVRPALTATEEDLDEVVDRLRMSVHDVAGV
ncbi:aspartate aminotransferase family protein [Sinosporangium siamense]|uniref:aspartate aminotransferase family protein n=1 Tax=Sinosporangium siamense TaxID=1367973 RepID=UPI0035ED37AF